MKTVELHKIAEQAITRIVKNGVSDDAIPINFRTVLESMGNRDRYTHLIHSYPAKLFYRIPQLILLSEIGKKSNLVVDPFCGSGTVLLEALLENKNSCGIDINPIAKLISRVKTGNYNEGALKKKWRDIKKQMSNGYVTQEQVTFPNIDYWFDSKTIHDLNKIRSIIEKTCDDNFKDFFEVCFSSIIRKVSLADPSIAHL